MDLELYLYAALAAGYLAGRLRPVPGPWVPRATFGAVVLLVGFLGASFRGLSGAVLLTVLPEALGFAALVLVATGAIALALTHRARAPSNPGVPVEGRRRVPASVYLLGALVGGFGAGTAVALPTGTLVPIALAGLLALVGFSLELRWDALTRAWVPITAAVGGAGVAALAFAGAARVGLVPSFAVAVGFGWYSLTGPLVGARFGAALGLLAFLANFCRESLTMILAPLIGRRLRGEGLAALGGATSMDTTLYFVVRHGDARAGSLALASGLALTVAASVLVPLVLAL